MNPQQHKFKKMKRQYKFSLPAALLFTAVLMLAVTSCRDKAAYRALIISGQAEYDRETASQAVKQILDASGLFSTDVLTAPEKGEDLSGLSKEFSKYNLIAIAYRGDVWPENAYGAFTAFLEGGGGLLVYYPKTRFGETGRDEPVSSAISRSHTFEVKTVQADHPVTSGLPVRWLQPGDIIVTSPVLPGSGIKVLATAFSDTAYGGSGRPEPVLLAGSEGGGRIFATMIGLPGEEQEQAVHSTGFIATLQRGAEWAASGNVTQAVPSDFPTAAAAVTRTGFRETSTSEAFRMMAAYDIGKSTRYYTHIREEIRKAGGDQKILSGLEKEMVKILNSSAATAEAKKLMLRELGWMGSDYCVNAVKRLIEVPGLKEEAESALERLGK